MNLSPLQQPDATPAAALEAVRDASRVNDQRRDAWDKWHLGLRVWSVGCRVYGLVSAGFLVEVAWLRVKGLWLSGFTVEGLGRKH